jgi:hypothetical protein
MTDKQLAGNQRRSLRTLRAKLIAMSDEWDGRDEFNRSELTRLADDVEEVAGNMIDDSEVTP